jgi:hypothetical protein
MTKVKNTKEKQWMTLKELAELCANAINTTGKEYTPRITLRLPEGDAGSRYRFLSGRKSPKGTIVAWGFDGYDTVVFDAVDVLAFLTACGVVEIKNG